MAHTAQWQILQNNGHNMVIGSSHMTQSEPSSTNYSAAQLPRTPTSSPGSPPWGSSATSQAMTTQRTNFDFRPPSVSTHISGHTRTVSSTAKRQCPFTSGPENLLQELKSVRKELRRVSSERNSLRSQKKDLKDQLKSFKLNAQGKQGILVEKNRKLMETIQGLTSRDDFHAAFQQLQRDHTRLQNASTSTRETVRNLQASCASLQSELESRADREAQLMKQHEDEAEMYEKYVASILEQQKELQARCEAAEDELSTRFAALQSRSHSIADESSVGSATAAASRISDQLSRALGDTIRSVHRHLASAESDLPGAQRADLVSHLGTAVSLINAAS